MMENYIHKFLYQTFATNYTTRLKHQTCSLQLTSFTLLINNLDKNYYNKLSYNLIFL